MPIDENSIINMSESLFAHINNDAFLIGSVDLQGQKFQHTIRNLIKYVRQLESHQRSQFQYVPETVYSLLEDCETLLDFEIDIEVLNQTKQPSLVKALQDLAKKKIDEIYKLKVKKKSLLMPGGWISPVGGHAMIYRFQYDSEDNLLFSIINSGSGLNFHEKTSRLDTDVYNPVLHYKIPKERINPDIEADRNELNRMMEALISPQIRLLSENDLMNASYLYQNIFPKWSFLGGYLVSDKQVALEHWYTSGQISGTCAQRSLHQMLKVLFPTLDAYRRFIYGLKSESLADYMLFLRSSRRIEDIQYHGQVVKAIRHQMRLLLLQSTINPLDTLFEHKHIDQEKDILLAYLAELDALKLPQTLSTQFNLRNVDEIKQAIGFNTEFKGLLTSAELFAPQAGQIIPPTSLLTLDEREDLLNNLTRLIQHCKMLQDAKQDLAVIEQLENYFLVQLPVPCALTSEYRSSFYAKKLTHNDILSFFEKINTLQEMYFDSCEQTLGQNVCLPRMLLFKFNLIVLFYYIDAYFPISKVSFFEYQNSVLALQKKGLNTVFIANNVPLLDKRLQDLLTLCVDPFPPHPPRNNYDYFQSIVDTEPELKAQLINRFQQGDTRFCYDTAHYVRAAGLESLFYFTEHRKTLGEAFFALESKFQRQTELELGVRHSSWEGLMLPRRATFAKNTQIFRLNLSTDPIKLICFHPCWHSQTLSADLVRSYKYGFGSNAPFIHVLDHPFRASVLYRESDDNHIQLYPSRISTRDKLRSYKYEHEQHKYVPEVIGPAELECRSLFFLRSAPDFQLALMLDYFNEHLDKLSRHEIQVYIEANLFQPGILLAELVKNPPLSFLERFDELVVNGLRYYEKKGQLTKNSLFFIRIHVLLTQYLVHHDARIFAERFDKCYQLVDGHLKSTSNAHMKASLHQYRFKLGRLSLMHFPNTNSKHRLADALISYFASQAFGSVNEQLDTDTQFQLKMEKHQFSCLLDMHSDKIEHRLLFEIAKELSLLIHPDSHVIVGHYPTYDVRTRHDDKMLYVFNVTSGRVYKNDFAFGCIPLSVLSHPIVKILGLDDVHLGFVQSDDRIIQLEKGSTILRFIKQSQGYVVCRQFKNEQMECHWSQFMGLSSEHAFHFKTASSMLIEGLAESFNETNRLVWVNINNRQLVLTDKNDHCDYIGEFTMGRYNLMNTKTKAQLIPEHLHSLPFLSRFESAKWILVEQKISGEYEIRLTRYHLTFSKETPQADLKFHYQGVDYSLNKNAPQIAKGVAHLMFSGEKGDICLLAIQPFISSKMRNESSEYYTLLQDIDAKALKAFIDSQSRNSDSKVLCEYTNTERYVVMTMQAGKPIPKTPDTALFLAYIYLGSHQPERAWEVLEYCDKKLGGLVGSYNEMYFLNWILNALPLILDKDDAKSVLQTPMVIACQLKALALLTQYLKQDNTILFPALIPENSAYIQYQNSLIEKTQSFYGSLMKVIHNTYRQYQSMRRSQSVQFNLSDEERGSLLDYYAEHLPGNSSALGALAFEQVSLWVSRLHKEASELEARTHKTSFDVNRLNEINQFIQQHEGIRRNQSQLVYRPIDLSLPKTIESRFQEQISGKIPIMYINNTPIRNYLESSEFFLGEREFIKNYMDCLSSTMTDKAFLNGFDKYLRIANGASLYASSNIHKLKAFCVATLVANHQINWSEQWSVIPLLCNVLYRVMCNQSTLIEYHKIKTYKDIIDAVRTVTPEDISIPQLVDDTHAIMMTLQNVWEGLPSVRPKVRPMLSADEEREIHCISFSSNLPELEEAKIKWNQVNIPDLAVVEQPTISSLFSQNEYRFGGKQYDYMLTLKKFSAELFRREGLLRSLMTLIGSQRQTYSERLKQLENESIVLANSGKGLRDHELDQRQLEELALLRRPLSIEDLLRLYFQANQEQYDLETHLPKADIDTLHRLLATYLATGLVLKQIDRVTSGLAELEMARGSPMEEQVMYQLARTLFATNQVDVVKEPELTVFQYHANLLLHSKQKEALSRLMRTSFRENEPLYKNVIEKIIMGGGKSKVILPAMVQQKANGLNLVIIEVPKALLRTNYTDLKSTSGSLFNQTAVLFEFNRDSNCSAKRLEALYHQWTSMMINRQYMVTTGSSLQSLELKYLELLAYQAEPNAAKEDISEHEQQLIWLEKLVVLLRHRADLMIDEVHQGLQLKTKLNYTLSESRSVPNHLRSASVKLYQFFKQVNLGQCPGVIESSLTFLDVVLNHKLLRESGQWLYALSQLAETLVDDTLTSPLASFVKKNSLNKAEKTVLKNYLLNKSNDIPPFVQQASANVKDMLALYKEEVSYLLGYTLRRNYGEHYGPSHLSSTSPSKQAIAIPYLANNVPNERSRFGNYLESINFTIQSLLIGGINERLLRQYLENLLVTARNEQRDHHQSSIEETPSGKLYQFLVGDHQRTLGELDLDDSEQMKQLTRSLGHHSELILEILSSEVLQHIQIDASILHSDAYNHVNLFRTCQGMSGSPDNHLTFHQRLQFDSTRALGTDGYVYAGVKHKNPLIKSLAYKNVESSIDALFSQYDAGSELRVIIDVAAMFKGVSNVIVAKAIAAYISQHEERFSYPGKIQYVLYFDDRNQLTALPIRDLQEPSHIVLGTSDNDTINIRLSCSPVNRFTYYDQAHSVGTDIQQSTRAKALVMIEQETTLSSFYQGVMRMRGLIEGQQSIDLIVPPQLAHLNLENLVEMMNKFTHEQLGHDIIESARLKMNNVVRNDLLNRILTIQGPESFRKKQFAFSECRAYFVEQSGGSFFDQYGLMKSEIDPAIYIKDLRDRLLDQWETTLKRLNVECESQYRDAMYRELDDIVRHMLESGISLPPRFNAAKQEGVTVEVECENEVQVEVQHQLDVRNETFNPSLDVARYVPWEDCDPHRLKESDHLKPLTLTEIAQSIGEGVRSPEFYPNIMATRNFYQTYVYQNQFVSAFLKPVHAILFCYHPNIKQLSAVLLTQRECMDVAPNINKAQDVINWITTTQHTLLAGHQPAGIFDNREYRCMIEQIRFFNGELQLLVHNKEDLDWLLLDSKNKLSYFETFLYACHETTSSDLTLLRHILLGNNQVIQFILNHPGMDWAHFNWIGQFDDCSDEEIEEYRCFSAEHSRISHSWLTLNLPAIAHDVHGLNIGIMSKSSLVNYIMQLHSIKQTLIQVRNSRF